jgi:hypothetical protein
VYAGPLQGEAAAIYAGKCPRIHSALGTRAGGYGGVERTARPTTSAACSRRQPLFRMLRLEAVTGVPLFTTWDSVAGLGRTPDAWKQFGPGNSAVPSTVGRLDVDGFWIRDYGGRPQQPSGDAQPAGFPCTDCGAPELLGSTGAPPPRRSRFRPRLPPLFHALLQRHHPPSPPPGARAPCSTAAAAPAGHTGCCGAAAAAARSCM